MSRGPQRTKNSCDPIHNDLPGPFDSPVKQESLYHQPKQCTSHYFFRETPESYHRFLLFDPPKMGNLYR